MTSTKLQAGDAFPNITVSTLDGDTVTLGQPAAGCDWQLVVVYRGKHCPICTRYLNNLETIKQGLADIHVDMIAVSGDSKAQLEEHLSKLEVSFPLYYGLSQKQMQQLGLYISLPRSENETDHNFAEPGMFVINQDGNLQVVDISNNPFARPEIDTFLSGLQWIRNPENNYPIRGTANYI